MPENAQVVMRSTAAVRRSCYKNPMCPGEGRNQIRWNPDKPPVIVHREIDFDYDAGATEAGD